ncbi:hypothetical protein OSTOST_22446, partial [Ostertagia ostertagi]
MLVVLLAVCILMANAGKRNCTIVFPNECQCYYRDIDRHMCCSITLFKPIEDLGKSYGKKLLWNFDIEMLAKQDVTGPSLPHLKGYADATLWNTFGTSNENMKGKVARTMHEKQGYLSNAV